MKKVMGIDILYIKVEFERLYKVKFWRIDYENLYYHESRKTDKLALMIIYEKNRNINRIKGLQPHYKRFKKICE